MSHRLILLVDKIFFERPPVSPASPTTRMRTLSMASASEALGTEEDPAAPVRDDHIGRATGEVGKEKRRREDEEEEEVLNSVC